MAQTPISITDLRDTFLGNSHSIRAWPFNMGFRSKETVLAHGLHVSHLLVLG